MIPYVKKSSPNREANSQHLTMTERPIFRTTFVRKTLSSVLSLDFRKRLRGQFSDVFIAVLCCALFDLRDHR